MVEEVISALEPQSDGCYVDCTAGEGGHSEAILKSCEPAPRLVGLDLDPDALLAARDRLSDFGERATMVEANYVNVVSVASKLGCLPCDGVLLDLGVSSLQLNTAERGFSFLKESSLDMRFGPSVERSAHEIVNETDEEDLADLIYGLGDERKSRRIARAIVSARPFDSTTQLAAVIARAAGWSGRGRRIHPATRTFQALRIAVNAELDNIDTGIREAIKALKPGGRLVVISYHSIEDRLVKTALREKSTGTQGGANASLKQVTKKVIKPSRAEIESNRRSRSARMRIAERL